MPRFLQIDREEKATRCPTVRISDFQEHHTKVCGDLVHRQAGRCMDCGVPFCMTGCPLGNKIPNFNRMVYGDEWDDAIDMLHSTNNFPEFTGRVCPAPCESSCVLGLIKPAVSIKQIEMTIAEKGFENGRIFPVKPEVRTGKKVLVIGAGPAGLACSQQLNRVGHLVTVMDKAPYAGGLLTYGIPEYKLPKSMVLRRVDQLKEEGICFRFSCEVGKDVHFQDLKKEYDAVVLCVGSENPRDLVIPGREGSGVYFAMDYLSQQSSDLSKSQEWSSEKLSPKDKKVIVIGGGDTGADCIGTSLRLGASSVVNFELMPKAPEERCEDTNPWPQYKRVYRVSSSMEENLALGGNTEYSIATKRFIRNEKGDLKALETVRVDWTSGRPVELAGSEQQWLCDMVFLALGYLQPLTENLLQETHVSTTERGNISTEEESKMTVEEGVFAAGDCRRGQSLVVWAIAEGRDTAAAVDTWLMERPSLLPRVNTQGYKY
ncbi:MAG: glutamate synthase (NADPH/NADH) small chain [Chlamydiales bacterium]|jgi:glutamate synthase (NADPH/NADH) small chain